MHAHAQLTRLLGTLHCRCRCRCRCEGALMISANTHKIGFLLSVFISFQFSLFYFSFKENSLFAAVVAGFVAVVVTAFFLHTHLKAGCIALHFQFVQNAHAHVWLCACTYICTCGSIYGCSMP